MTTLAPARETATAVAPHRHLTQPSPLAGFGHQLRFMVRRDRVRAAVWLVALVGLLAASAASVLGLYSTPADLQGYAEVAQADAAIRATTGPGYGLDPPTEGAVVMNETELYTFVAIALMSIFMVIRHTRAEEESDRAELVRSAPVGRLSSLAAACTWVTAISAAIGTGLTLSMVASGLPIAGSLAFGAAAAGVGLVFVGVGAVSAQTASSARAARATAGAALGLAFVLRAVGDVGNGALSWLSPLGWGQSIRAYADEQWWVLALLAVAATGLLAAAVSLSARRDLGAGLVRQRPGPARGDPRLSTPLALARRLQRPSAIGWVVGLGLTGFFFGIIADQADQLAENQAVADILAQSGQGTVTESFLATLLLMAAVIASGFTVGSVLRSHGEESAHRVEPILAGPTSRRRWLASHLIVAAGGTVVVMVVTGLTTGLGYAVGGGDAGEVLPVLGGALAMVPALWVLGAVGIALVGLRPRWALLAWAGVAVSAVVAFLAETLDLPQWVRDVSPLQHVPLLPAATFELLPIAVLLAVAAALVGVGAVAIDRRDFG